MTHVQIQRIREIIRETGNDKEWSRESLVAVATSQFLEFLDTWMLLSPNLDEKSVIELFRVAYRR